ncbi:Hsp20/alpha crystallin family protein [Streptomyces sp. ISL-99]|uniref:Hsp20/alpha crystallin family protein n=1 Tax=Streptomyces sp. ISL-99 TaxID=2819193 RepID=UPI001BEBFF42|nr:Hsp20/alpha crystallin family protein [Streptomyces sp. ISL-99]MBT2529806.1 Hsp20/alpha crystallin family protein [Streptomyces sp. ISL-99]
MLMRTDPFRELDRLAQQRLGTTARSAVMPMDAYRHEGALLVHLDLPGIDPEPIDLNVEQNVLTVKAERSAQEAKDVDMFLAERPHGIFNREVFLSETLDADHIEASYDAGVLIMRILVAEAKARKIEVSHGGSEKKEITS